MTDSSFVPYVFSRRTRRRCGRERRSSYRRTSSRCLGSSRSARSSFRSKAPIPLCQDFHPDNAHALVFCPESIVGTRGVTVHQSLPIAFILHEYFELPEIARFPVAQIGFLDHGGSDNPPTQFGPVCESDADIENAFLECMVSPMHDLAMDTWVLLAVDNSRGDSLTGDFRFVIGWNPALASAWCRFVNRWLVAVTDSRVLLCAFSSSFEASSPVRFCSLPALLRSASRR